MKDTKSIMQGTLHNSRAYHKPEQASYLPAQAYDKNAEEPIIQAV